MLRNIDPILSPSLLHALRAMGHGDEIVIADANFPGTSTGPDCIRADGSTANEVLRAVLSVMPLDIFVTDPALTMQVVGDPDAIPEAVADFQNIIDTTADNPAKIQGLEASGLTPEEFDAEWQSFEDQLLVQRNANWMEIILSLKDQTAVIAVGAGHLRNDYGLLNQLQQAGYTLERAEF